MLLKEVRVLTDLQVISESRDTGVMCIRGTFQRAEEENHNRRIYPKAVLESCVKNLHEKLSGRELVGELDHPADGVVKLQNASHLITKLEWQGNDLIGEAEILPTPAGQIAKSLINAGVKIGISSRGMGTLSEASEGSKIVNDDYKMITFDLVADPSTKGAYPSLAESKQHALEFVENVIKPALSEKAFVARLKKKLNEAKEQNNPWAICTAQVGRGDEAKYERCVKKVKTKTSEDNDMNEMCGPKHKKKKALKKLVSENFGSRGPRPLTLTTLVENNLINEGIGDFFSGIRGAFGGDKARRNSVMALKSRRLQRQKTGSDAPLMTRGDDGKLRTPRPTSGGALSRVRMRQGARARYGDSPRTSDRELRSVGGDHAAGKQRRREEIRGRLQAMSRNGSQTSQPSATKKPRQGMLPF